MWESSIGSPDESISSTDETVPEVWKTKLDGAAFMHKLLAVILRRGA